MRDRRAARHETMHTLVVRPPPLAGLPGSEADGRGRAPGSKLSAISPPAARPEGVRAARAGGAAV